MITDLCTWAYDLAVSWLPPVPSFLWGEEEEEAAGPRPEEAATAPGTTEALARARDALRRIETVGEDDAGDGLFVDARLRAGTASLFGTNTGGGILRLAGRLDELDVTQLGAADRDTLMSAAASLVERLRQA